MREPCVHPARRLRYVGYLRGTHRVVCEVEHCGALLPLAESGQHAAQDHPDALRAGRIPGTDHLRSMPKMGAHVAHNGPGGTVRPATPRATFGVRAVRRAVLVALPVMAALADLKHAEVLVERAAIRRELAQRRVDPRRLP